MLSGERVGLEAKVEVDEVDEVGEVGEMVDISRSVFNVLELIRVLDTASRVGS